LEKGGQVQRKEGEVRVGDKGAMADPSNRGWGTLVQVKRNLVTEK